MSLYLDSESVEGQSIWTRHAAIRRVVGGGRNPAMARDSRERPGRCGKLGLFQRGGGLAEQGVSLVWNLGLIRPLGTSR